MSEQPTPNTPQDAIAYCNQLIGAFKSKADHNKSESLRSFLLVIASTLIAPLFVTLGSGVIAGKVVPSVLSLTAAGATAWLQLRKPQQLWALYRSAQRELEDALIRFTNGIGDYEGVDDPHKILIEKAADIAMLVHKQWLPLVPNPEKLDFSEKIPKTRSR